MRILLIICFAVLVASCNKELDDSFTPYGASLQPDTTWRSTLGTNATVHQIHDIFTDQYVVINFKAEDGGSFPLNDSLKVEVPANALQKNGSSVSGQVSMVIRLYRSKFQLLGADISTLNNNSLLLETVGAMNIQFVQSGEKLSLAPNKKYTLVIKTSTQYSIAGSWKVYHRDSTSAGLSPLWTPTNDGSTVTVTGQSPAQYFLDLTRTGWIECGKEVESSGAEKVQLNAVLPLMFTNANTIVYAMLKGNNTIVRLRTDINSKSFFGENFITGKQVVLVSISKINDKFYVGTAEAIVAKNAIIKIKPEAKNSVSEVLDLLKNL